MKQLLLCAVITVLLALATCASVQSSNTEVIVLTSDGVSKGNDQVLQFSEPDTALQRFFSQIRVLTVGTVGDGDRRIYRNYFRYEGSDLVHTFIYYRGSRGIPISAIHVTEIGHNLHTVAELIDGGIGKDYATFRISIPGGNKFLIRLDMWGQL